MLFCVKNQGKTCFLLYVDSFRGAEIDQKAVTSMKDTVSEYDEDHIPT